ncbi:MAG: preprotein translocase subunit SecG [Arcobacteraceae bacterium]
MTSTLLVVQVILAIILTITVLLQKSSSIGLGAYSGSNESLFGAKGPANFLTKATMTIGLLFVINTLILGYTYNSQRLESVVDSVKMDTLVPSLPAAATPSNAPAAPDAPVPATNK